MVDEYSFVKNEPEYYEFIRELRLDHRVSGGFISTENITKEQQIKYMSKHGDCFHICLINRIPAGYIGVIDNDIRIATHPNFQRKGVGKYMLEMLYSINPNAVAKIKIDNQASLKLFQSCGFKIKYYLLEKD